MKSAYASVNASQTSVYLWRMAMYVQRSLLRDWKSLRYVLQLRQEVKMSWIRHKTADAKSLRMNKPAYP